ncbi:hypothetical protein IFM89_039003 [Coptis chinensis]|uniref:Pentatricopeptide repeat-containing protein n=1 Tax=Coptis chinensis TaxID=261450 RepID=A0A835IHD1_9MAGN|nr:hypothetical protein IFM89_039003 [Coptis chinensis]
MGERKLVNDKTFRIGVKYLAEARELKKCVEIFHLMNAYGFVYELERLNKVIETLCGEKLVFEAKYIVMKMKEFVQLNGVTYKLLIVGFCEVGDMIEASKFWNLMVDEGFELEVEAMMDTFFKNNRVEAF